MKREFPKTWGMSAGHPGTQAFLAQRDGVAIPGPWLEGREEEDDEEDEDQGDGVRALSRRALSREDVDDCVELDDDYRQRLAHVAEQLGLDEGEVFETALQLAREQAAVERHRLHGSDDFDRELAKVADELGLDVVDVRATAGL